MTPEVASPAARTHACVEPGVKVRFEGPLTSSVGAVLSTVTVVAAVAEACPLTSVARADALAGPSGSWAESKVAANGAPVAFWVAPPSESATRETPKLSLASAATVTAPRT